MTTEMKRIKGTDITIGIQEGIDNVGRYRTIVLGSRHNHYQIIIEDYEVKEVIKAMRDILDD